MWDLAQSEAFAISPFVRFQASLLPTLPSSPTLSSWRSHGESWKIGSIPLLKQLGLACWQELWLVSTMRTAGGSVGLGTCFVTGAEPGGSCHLPIRATAKTRKRKQREEFEESNVAQTSFFGSR